MAAETKTHLLIQHKDRDWDVEVDPEKLRRPILDRAGIVDLNHAFELLPEKLKQKCGTYPNINGFEPWPMIHELRQEVRSILHRHEYVYGGRENNEHWLYPVTQDGLIAQIADTKLFQRLFGVHQLGPNREYPLHNHHSRAQHSIHLSINAARTLQALHDNNPDLLVQKARADLIATQLAEEDMSNQEILNLYTDILITTTMIHDLATPAGGDTIKYLLNLDEEKDLRWLLSQNPELLKALQDRGFDERHVAFCIACVQGKSDSLIGQMIHPPEGDYMDWDRISYTLFDGLAIQLFTPDVPESLLPEELGEVDSFNLYMGLQSAIEALDSGATAVLGVHDKVLPGSLIDTSENYVLDTQGRLICTRPDRLAWLSAYRSWMIARHYAGHQMLGVEWELQQRLRELIENGITNDILTMETLLTITDRQLYDELLNLGDTELNQIIGRIRSTAGTTLFTGIVKSEKEKDGRCYAQFPLKIKPGFDSLVSDNGKVITLGEWVKQNNRLLSSFALQQSLDRFQGKWIVIYEV